MAQKYLSNSPRLFAKVEGFAASASAGGEVFDNSLSNGVLEASETPPTETTRLTPRGADFCTFGTFWRESPGAEGLQDPGIIRVAFGAGECAANKSRRLSHRAARRPPTFSRADRRREGAKLATFDTPTAFSQEIAPKVGAIPR